MISAALALTAVRAIAIEWILIPVARRAGLKRKGSIRFAEQGWQAVYYGFIWAVGLVWTRWTTPWKESRVWLTIGLLLIVPVEKLLLLVRLQCRLDRMARSPTFGPHEMVSSRGAVFPGAADLHDPRGRETERPLSDADPPYYYVHSSELRVHLRLLQCVQRCAVLDGHC